jgi:hypothetical protein
MSKNNANLLVIFLLLTLYMVTFGDLQTVNTAKAYPTYGIPPKVNVPETNINATIFRVDEALWVKIDAEYKMHTVYALGDSYIAENTGMGLIADPSPYVTVIVTQDTLEAHYPIPFNTTHISVWLNGEEVESQIDSRGYFHIFDTNLQEINWTVSPVPRDFVVAIHYELPISKTSPTYTYLGDYAFTLPLFGRYGCSNISYPLYSWYGYSPNKYSIQIESDLTELQAYSIDTRGTLTPLNNTLIDGKAGRMTIAFSREEKSPSVHGAVVVFNVPEEETLPFPTVPVAAVSVAVVALVVAGLLVYHKKHKHNSVKKV